jgi:mRNA interferase YafQ
LRQIKHKNTFKQDVELAKKRGKDLSKLTEVIKLLERGEILPVKYKDHKLIGNNKGRRECHLEPNWLLIYKLEDNLLIFERLGSHSDLFK